jgi:hypothetical protein
VATLIAALLLTEPSAFAAFAPTAPQDNGWPRQFTKNGSTLICYQPQIDDWKGF